MAERNFILPAAPAPTPLELFQAKCAKIEAILIDAKRAMHISSFDVLDVQKLLTDLTGDYALAITGRTESGLR